MAGALSVAACAARHAPATATSARPASPANINRPTSPRAVAYLRRDLGDVFGAPITARGMWAVDVRSLATGQTLFELSADKLVMPASNMKILTLATAAEILGWDYTFTTSLETTAPVENGVLRGDLIVRGTGDPTINARDGRASKVMDEWALALRSAGIVSIAGRIIGDDQAFDDDGVGAGWSWDYLQYGYAAPVGALQFNENIADLTIAPAEPGAVAIVGLTPGSGLTLVNRAITGPAGSEETIDYRRRLDAPVLEVMGSVPAGSKPITRQVAVVNPTTYFAQALKDGLAARGVAVEGGVADFDDVAAQLATAPPRRVLASATSPPLTSIATVLMKVSQNLYAETLLKACGAARGGLGTTRAGIEAVRATLSGWGVPEDGYVMYDGSGLSRYNYVTARTLTAVLARLYQEERHRGPFTATLPIAGTDGTIRSRMKDSRAAANAIAKTGSIANVRALSGYLHTRDGEPLVFSIVANDFVVPPATINWIADLAVEILSNFTRDAHVH